MAIRAKALTIRPFTLCDAIDGTNAPPGGMSQLQNLIPSPYTRNQFVARPAEVQANNFSSFIAPVDQSSVQLVIGDLVWGMLPTGRNSGHDEPYCYNLVTGTFVTISNITTANTPVSQTDVGDWTPPRMWQVNNGRIIITHPGYNFGGGYAIGWIDISSFSSNTVTGSTHSNTTIDTLSTDVLTGPEWQVGQHITGAGIPANTYITAIAANGLSITISNAASATAAGVTLTVTGGTPSAPIYGAGQTSPVALVAQPVDVSQFFGRAYYCVLNGVAWSDIGFPTQVTNANQAVLLGDTTPTNALAPLPLTNQVTGGTTQALIVFKGAQQFYQITGDAASTSSPLTISSVPSSVGTLSPNSICGTPLGMAFIAPDGLRILRFSGTLDEPIGAHGDGVNVPFLNVINPTRTCMAYNNNTLRVTCNSSEVPTEPFLEYWYDFNLKAWNGPHTFPAALISARRTINGNDFVVTAQGIGAGLWVSDAVPNANSTYTENGNPMNFVYQTILLPDNNSGAMNSVVESMLGIAQPANSSYNVLASDELNGTLSVISINGMSGSATIWGSFTWGTVPWGSANAIYQQIPLLWDQPLVFKQMRITIAGVAAADLVLGNLYLRYEVLGYEYAPPV